MPGGKSVWWGRFSLSEGNVGRWRVGALTLWAERRPREWRLTYVSTNDPYDSEVDIQASTAEAPPLEGVTTVRFAMSRTDDTLSLTPALPDRPVVSRPETPFYVLAGEDVRLYISSPVWATIKAGDHQLLEVPIYRPSDTWFGPNTCEGELCYASRTNCRSDLEDIPVRPHRAIAAVRIRNRSRNPILIERVNLPVHYLSLFSTADGGLWTQAVTLEMARGGSTAEIQIGKEAPPEAKEAKKISDYREAPDKNLLVRALSALIG